MAEDCLNVLEMLDKLNSDFSYETICRISDEQKAEYHARLEEFKSYHSMNEHDEDVPENLHILKGKCLENLVVLLFRMSGNLFIVENNLRTNTNEIDQVLIPTPKAKYLINSGILNKRYELFLGECKNYHKPLSVTYVGKFCSLLLSCQIKLGIIFSYHGITGNGWNYASGLVKKFYLHKEKEEDRYCIIDFSIDDFEAIDRGENLLRIIDEKLLQLRLDTNYLKYLSKHPAE